MFDQTDASTRENSTGRITQWTRRAAALALTGVLAACTVVPKGPPAPPPAPPPVAPTPPALPTDTDRHRVALLVPMSGANAAVGQALANASTMALLDMNASNLRITTYDTAGGVAVAAQHALADGNKLILGPLLGEEAEEVGRVTTRAHVPVISFSNDYTAAGGEVFVMGTVPAQAIMRVVRHARGLGATRFGALIPLGTYGERASNAAITAIRASGGTLVDMESYDRAPGSLVAAVRRLKAKGAYDAVLVADKPQAAAQVAPALKAGAPGLRILGTELWNGEGILARTPTMKGSLFAALPEQNFRAFAERYRGRYGEAPYRLATMGYDGVLLSLRIAREWQPGRAFPTARLYDRGGFLGTDGIFRFNPTNIIERSLEVREVRFAPQGGSVVVVSPAPVRFDD